MRWKQEQAEEEDEGGEEVGEKRRIPPRRTFWRKMYAGAGMCG